MEKFAKDLRWSEQTYKGGLIIKLKKVRIIKKVRLPAHADTLSGIFKNRRRWKSFPSACNESSVQY